MRPTFVLLIVIVLVAPARADIVPGSKNLGAIWIIGDSITQGNASGDAMGTYRSDLYNLLTADGYTFGLTGHSNANNAGLPVGYQYHSGVSGAMIQNNYNGRTGIEQNIAAWWSQGQLATSKPNVILLMIGTNDVNLGYNTSTAPARLSSLIQSLYTLAGNDVSLFVASIPPQGTSSAVTTFNAKIPGIVDHYRTEGRDIHFVDIYSAINASYSTLMNGDNLHPNGAGNEVIAETWRNAIEAAAAVPEPSCCTLTLSAILGLLAYAWKTSKQTPARHQTPLLQTHEVTHERISRRSGCA